MYPDAYIQYLVHFHGDRDYFECHEILEEYWKTEQVENRLSFWVGLIQIAVAAYHHRRNNFRGGIRLLLSAINILEHEEKNVTRYGLDYKKLIILLTAFLQQMKEGKEYRSITLPIKDPILEKKCKQHCATLGLEWNSKSDLSNIFIVNKHTMRDRTDVVEERKKQIEKRKQGK